MTPTPDALVSVERRRLAKLAFAMEVSAIEPDTRLCDLTDDETDSIIDGVLAADRLSTPSLQTGGEGNWSGAFYAESIAAVELQPGTQVVAIDSFMRAVNRALSSGVEGETVPSIPAGMVAGDEAETYVEKRLREGGGLRLVSGSPTMLSDEFARYEAERIASSGGRFREWTTHSLAQECLAQAREQLDPEFSQFMTAVAERLAASPKPTTVEASGMVERRYRIALQDIAEAEAIPNDAVAFVWCRDVAREALSASSPSSEQGRG